MLTIFRFLNTSFRINLSDGGKSSILIPNLAMVLHTLLISPGYAIGKWATDEFPLPALMFMRIWFSFGIFLVIFFGTKWILKIDIFDGFLSAFTANESEEVVREVSDNVKTGIAFHLKKIILWKRLGVLVLLGAVGNQLLFMFGLRYITPSQSALLFAITPLLVTIISIYALRVEKWSLPKILGITLALTGVCIVIFRSGLGNSSSSNWIGFLTTMGSVFFWAGYLSLSRKWLKNVNPLAFVTVLLGAGALIFTPIAISNMPETNYAVFSQKAWFGLGYLTVISSVTSYLLMMFALTKMSASRVSIYMNAQPVIATIFSILMGFELVSFPFILGGSMY